MRLISLELESKMHEKGLWPQSRTAWAALSVLAIVLVALAGFRWMRSQLLWRLRNRLIVTYVFIGVIPVFLLVIISLITLYLFAGQFASFVVTSEITSRLRSMESSNRAIAHQLANRFRRGETFNVDAIGGIRP